MNAPRRPRRPEGAPELETYVTLGDVERVTGLPPSSARALMHTIARLAGLDLSRRATKRLLLPVTVWREHSAAALAPPAEAAPRAPAPTYAPPSRPPQRGHAEGTGAPAVKLTSPRRKVA